MKTIQFYPMTRCAKEDSSLVVKIPLEVNVILILNQNCNYDIIVPSIRQYIKNIQQQITNQAPFIH